jgi:hypothetical protein
MGEIPDANVRRSHDIRAKRRTAVRKCMHCESKETALPHKRYGNSFKPFAKEVGAA